MASKETASYHDIDVFNQKIITDNFLGNVIFGRDVKLQNSFISMFLDHIERSFNELSSKFIPIAVKETISMYRDHSGLQLKEYIMQSLGKSKSIDETLRSEYLEKRRQEEINLMLKASKAMCQKIPNTPISSDCESSSKKKNIDLNLSETAKSDGTLMSEYQKIKLQRDWHYHIITKEHHLSQLTFYKRLILFIQINVFARSKGLFLHEQGASIDHMCILKDIRDILIFSAPILWPECLEMIQNTNTSLGVVFHFPSEKIRSLIISLYKTRISLFLDRIINIQEFNDDIISRIPLDSFLKTCRIWLMNIINVDPRIIYQ